MRVILVVLLVAMLTWLVFAVRALSDPPVTGDPASTGVTVAPAAPVEDLLVAELRDRLKREHARYLQARRLLHRRWRPTVGYAIRLASAVTGVPAWELYAVGRCESGLYPFARNGRYRGVFQLGWAPFGLDVFDPIPNTLSAALTVQRDGGWRQWECKP